MVLALVWQPYFSPVSILAGAGVLAALALVAAVRSYRLRRGLSVAALLMRWVLIAALTVLLLGPSTLPASDTRPTRPTLHVVLDTSQSMQQADMDGLPRVVFALRRWLSDERLDALRAAYDVRLHRFDSTLGPLSALPDPEGDEAELASALAGGRTTDLAGSVRGLTAQARGGGGGDGSDDGSGVLLLSDGHDLTEQPMAPVGALARAKGLPIYAVPLGGPLLQQDVAVAASASQSYLLAGEEGRVRVRVLQSGADQDQTTLRVRSGDEDEQTFAVHFDGSPSVVIDVPVERDDVGLHEYVVEADALSDEVETGNNRMSVFVEVTDARLKVLLLEGQPYWDTKFLAQSLRKDERVELTQITQVSLTRRQRLVTRADADAVEVPTTLEGFAGYDVVIVGRGLEDLIDAETAALLPRYVSEAGGRLLFSRGQAYDAETPAGRAIGRELAVLEPAVWGRGLLHGRKLDVTDSGASHPGFAFVVDEEADESVRVLAALPELSVVPVVQRVKAAATVLAEVGAAGAVGGGGGEGAGGGQPVVAAMPYGRGMVVGVLGEGLWRWKLKARDRPELQGVFDRFWSNMVRWLAMGSDFQPGQDMALRLSSLTAPIGEPVNIDAVFRYRVETPPADLVITDPRGEERVETLRAASNSAVRLTSVFTPELPGTYRVELRPKDGVEEGGGGGVESRFQAFDLNVERLSSAARPEIMTVLAERSGGAVLDPYEPAVLLETLERQRASAVVPPTPKPLWDTPWVMTLLLVWAGAEWIMRKKGGLL
ncbi:MAG: hypothetical protein AAF750_03000 [Planctomycetota bacterium]